MPPKKKLSRFAAKRITVELEPDLKHNFSLACAVKNEKMTDVLRQLIVKFLVKESVVVQRVTRRAMKEVPIVAKK